MTKVKPLLKKNALVIIGIILLIIPRFTTQYEFYVVERGVQNAILVLGLLILIGYSGMLSLGSAGLLALGAYAYGILTVKLGLNPWIGCVAAVLLTTLLGTSLAFPAFRLSGPFLVVTTIGFGEIVRILLLNLENITGGAYGLSGIPNLCADPLWTYRLMVVSMVCLGIGTERIGSSVLGLAMKAIRQDVVAAEVMGVDVKRVKRLSFALSAAFAGFSGVFLANLTGYISPDSFTSAESATYLLMVVFGGLHSVVGTIVSAIVVTCLPEVFRFLSDSRLLMYSLVLLIYIRMHWVKPESGSMRERMGKLKTRIGAGKDESRG